MSPDARGWRMALVPDGLINPPAPHRPSLPDVLEVLESSGYGVLQLPPPGRYGPLLAVISDQIKEYAHHGYAVVAIGIHGKAGDRPHWRRLSQLLERAGVALPPRHLVRAGAGRQAEELRLAAFLAAHDLPVREQRRWRA